jgi:undecaprenyl pyrophosphate phosphatase UppP
MLWFYVVILAVVQGLAELLPISSSAHVIITAKLLHQDMATPAKTHFFQRGKLSCDLCEWALRLAF